MYVSKPTTSGLDDCSDDYAILSCFNHLFKMVIWEDEEPTSIADLLGSDKEGE